MGGEEIGYTVWQLKTSRGISLRGCTFLLEFIAFVGFQILFNFIPEDIIGKEGGRIGGKQRAQAIV